MARRRRVRVLARTRRTATGGTVTTTAAGMTTVRTSAGRLVSRTTRRVIATTTRTPEGGTRTVNVKGIVTVRDAAGRLISQTKKPLPTVTRRTDIGGTITVTPDGKVTERDSVGRLIRRFQAEEGSARSFILSENQRVNTLARELERVEKLKRQTPQTKEVKKKIGLLTVTAVKKERGLARIRQRLTKAKGEALVRITRAQFRQPGAEPGTAIGEAIFVLGAVGALRGVLGLVETVRHPIKTAKAQFQAFRPRNIRATFRGIGQEFVLDPVGTVAEFYTYSKALGLTGKAVKKSPLGKFVQERVYIQSLPKELRKPISQFLKSDKVQRRINPKRIPTIKRADFLKIQSLSPIEARAIAKAIKQTDPVLFGSFAGKITGRRPKVKTKLPLPKDLDIAVKSKGVFYQRFTQNLPKQIRRNYKVQRGKLIRISDKRPLLDVKLLSELMPSRSIFTRRGELPVTGFVKQLKKRPGSILPTIKKKPGIVRLTIPTKKLVKVKGIRLVGFAEQTTRKFLGTLQVLIEKNIRRAKDPKGFLLSLKIQLETLKLQKPKTRIGIKLLKRKTNTLKGSIKILQSKSFAILIDKKIIEGTIVGLQRALKKAIKKGQKGKIRTLSSQIRKNQKNLARLKKGLKFDLPTKYSLLKQINTRKLKQINIKDLDKRAKSRAKRAKPLPIPKKELRRPKVNQVFKEPSKLPIGREILPVSRLPSRLPPTKIPSVLPRIKPSRIPTRLPPTISRLPRSRIPRSILKSPSKIPSIIPTISKLPKVPPTKLPPTRLPRVPITKVPISKLKKIKIAKLKLRKKIIAKKKIRKIEKKQLKRLKKLVEKIPQMRKLVYIPDLYSRIYDIEANIAEKRFFLTPGRVFTGIFIRKLTGR